jgi:hypothetical protein
MRVPGDKFGDLVLVDIVASDPAGTWWIAREEGTTRGLWVPAEPQVLVDVVHPSVLPILRRIEDGGVEGAVYGVGAGTSLQDVLRQGRVDRASAQRWSVTLARVLRAAHEAGAVHGALSPRRVRVVGSEVVVWGFGTGPDPLVPAPGGEGASVAADTWAWGAVVYELLTGAPPFPGTAKERAARAATGAHQPLGVVCPELPDHVAALLYAVLSPAPASRPPLPTSFPEPWPDTADTLGRPSPPTIVAFDRSLSESQSMGLPREVPPVPPAPVAPQRPPASEVRTVELRLPDELPDPFPPPWLPPLAIAATVAAIVLVVLVLLALAVGV